MRLLALRPTLSTFRLATPRIPFLRAMSDVAQFVAAAAKADPILSGSDGDQAAITKANSEFEKIASDLKVRLELKRI